MRALRWLVAAYASSTLGTWLGFGAFPLLAVRVLGSGPLAVSGLAAAGLAVGAVLAVPLGPWVEGHRKRPTMIFADIGRCGVLLTVPVAYWAGFLTYGQLVVVSVLNAALNIAFVSASGAYLKMIVPPERLLAANGRLEATTWTATALGPTLGGAAISLLGPVATVVANACGFLLSAASVGMIRHPEGPAVATPRDLVAGWRFLWADGRLRGLFLNTALVNGLIMATEPLLAVWLLGSLGWPAWHYGLAFGLPCIGGFAGSRLSRRLASRYGFRRVLLVAGVLRVVWPVLLVFVTPGFIGLCLVISVELVLIACMGVFNPLYATARLRWIPAGGVSRTLVAWSVTNTAAVALLTALWGLLADLVGPRLAIGAAGLLLLATPPLLLSAIGQPRYARASIK